MKYVHIALCVALIGSIAVGNASAQLRSDPKPKLYPNKHLSQVGEAQASRDIASCSSNAGQYAEQSKQPGSGARAGLRGAAKGALLGTVGGAIMGNTGRGAAAGAVVGTTASAMKGINERGARDPVFQQYVNACLEDKGYRVLEWS